MSAGGADVDAWTVQAPDAATVTRLLLYSHFTHIRCIEQGQLCGSQQAGSVLVDQRGGQRHLLSSAA